MLNSFIHWYNDEFKQTQMYADMQSTREGSPWHREHSVAVHTDMVVMEYLMRVPEATHEDLLGAFAAAFHDVGKPGAEQRKWREDRGDYNSYNGHEQLSARMWEDWAVQNWPMLWSKFEFVPRDIYTVGYMIEMHKPWDIKRPEKLQMMNLTMLALGVDNVFVNLVKADTWGRMSDDQEQKRAKVTQWCQEFENRCYAEMGNPILDGKNYDNAPIMYVPIAASGSGKSTLLRENWKELGVPNMFSLDAMRHELYGDDYAYAFLQSTKDKHFKATCNARYLDLLRENKDLFLDNTSTSRKNRRFFLTEARKRGYRLVAMLLPVALEQIIERQTTRPDKDVPEEAVRRQYMGLQLPQYGEFDEVRIIDSNL